MLICVGINFSNLPTHLLHTGAIKKSSPPPLLHQHSITCTAILPTQHLKQHAGAVAVALWHPPHHHTVATTINCYHIFPTPQTAHRGILHLASHYPSTPITSPHCHHQATTIITSQSQLPPITSDIQSMSLVCQCSSVSQYPVF